MQRKHLLLAPTLFLTAGLALLVPGAGRVAVAAPPTTTERERINFDADWRFLRSAPSTLQSGLPITDWITRSTPGNAADADLPAMSSPTFDSTTGGWTSVHTGDDTFHGRVGFAYFRTTLPALPQPNRIVNFDGVDDNATVYLNGVKLTHHEGWNDAFTVGLDSAWHATGPNVLVVLVENTYGGGGVTGAVSVGNRTGASQSGEFSGEGVNDSRWRVVHLPHDYVVEGTFDSHLDAGHAALPTPAAWYRKTFTLPASDKGKAVWVDFDGAYRDSTVWLNGVLLGNHPSGYTGFRYDLSKAAHFGGSNVLAVHVNPHKAEGWWYEGGGLYRHVWLNVANGTHIAPQGVSITTDLPEPGADGKVISATINLTTKVANEGAAKRVIVMSRLIDASGKEVGSGMSAVPQPTAALPLSGSIATYVQPISLPNPHLWSIEAPILYTVETTVSVDGQVVDSMRTPFGIRTIRFDAEKGFFLNGKSVKIQGTCNHQDFIGVGTAMPDSVLYWRVKKLKEMGCNAIRMSHNPPATEFLDACDKMGVLVMDENRHLGDTQNPKTGKGTSTADLSDLREMILRDRNHPSIIMWSMCNEEPLQGSADGKRIFAAMMDEVHKWDTTRPITCAMNGGWGSGISDVEDLQGINYAPGAYEGFHTKFPTKPLYGSETASTVSARGDYEWEHWDRYYGNQTKAFVNAYDVNAPGWAQTAEDGWRPIAERSYVAGGYIWTGFDYKGEPTPFGWPDINSNFGVLDMCGFPRTATTTISPSGSISRWCIFCRTELGRQRRAADSCLGVRNGRPHRTDAERQSDRVAGDAEVRACGVDGAVRAGQAGSQMLRR